jgi:hypothetical protein
MNFKLKSTIYDRPDAFKQTDQTALKKQLGNYCAGTLRFCYRLILLLEIVVTCVQNEYGAEEKRKISQAQMFQ